MLSHVTLSPAIIRRSLLVNVLVNEGANHSAFWLDCSFSKLHSGRLDDALDEIERCLQDEDIIFNSENSCISDEAVRFFPALEFEGYRN